MSNATAKSASIMSNGITPPKSTSERSTSKEKRGYAYYDRIISYKKSLEERSVDYASSHPTSASLTDKVSTLFSSESKIDRLVRRRLTHYRGVLVAELKIVEKSLNHYNERSTSLAAGFTSQEAQLKRWGLYYAIPAFNQQMWARTTRNNILRDATLQIKRVLETRIAEVECFQKQLFDQRGKRDTHVHNLDEQFYLYPGELLGRDAEYIRLRYRISMIDKMCSTALSKFQAFLPELNSKTTSERETELLTIIESYSRMLASEPSAEILSHMHWEQYCAWFVQRQRSEADILMEFGSFVEDEREREGRLFCRWCAILRSEDGAEKEEERNKVAAGLVDSPENALLDAIGIESDYLADVPAKPRPSGPSTEPVSPEDVDFASPQYQLKCMSHVKCIRAFVRYYAINILCTVYKIPGPKQTLLLSLTDILVHRRIGSAVYRMYDQQDSKWLEQCEICRNIDPSRFGVSDEYLIIPPVIVDREKRPETDDKTIRFEIATTLDQIVSSIEIDTSIHRMRSYSSASAGKSVRRHRKSSVTAYLPSCEALQAMVPRWTQRLNDLSVVTNLEASTQPYLQFYGRAARILSTLTISISPKEIFFVVMQAMNMLLRCAGDISAANNNGKREVLGADSMFPLLVMTLSHANIPNMHYILEYLHHFSDIDSYGEIAYYVTSIEAAVEFIGQVDTCDPRRNSIALTPRSSMDSLNSLGKANAENTRSHATAGCSTSMSKSCQFGCCDMPANTALVYLGSWLRNQQLMEDTMIAMQKEGLIS